MNASLDPTKLPGYRPEWSITNRPPAPVEQPHRAVPKVISPRMARKITAAYHCAACWSALKIYWNIVGENAGQYTIECEYCGGDVPGFVTRQYITWRIHENEEEYRQAQIAMHNAYPNLFPELPKAERKPSSRE